MNRHWLVAVAVLATLPAAASAQLPGRDEGFGPRLRATPFVGFSPGVGATGKAEVVSTQNPFPSRFDFDFDLGSGPVSGVALDLRVYNQFSVVAAGAWSSRGPTIYHTLDSDFEDPGSDLWLARLGIGMRLREANPDVQLRRLSASIYAGGAMIREVPEVTVFSDPNFADAVNHWGVNLGAEGELPLGTPRLAFTLALEDNIIFWDEAAQARRLRPLMQMQFGEDAVGEIDSDHSHYWVLRAGLAFRFGR